MYTHDPTNDQLNLAELQRYLETEAAFRYRLWGVSLERQKDEQAERERHMYLNYKFWARAVKRAAHKRKME